MKFPWMGDARSLFSCAGLRPAFFAQRSFLGHMSGSTARLVLPGLSLGFLLPHHLDTLGQKLQAVSSILGARGHLFQIMESLWVPKLLSQFLQDGLHFSED